MGDIEIIAGQLWRNQDDNIIDVIEVTALADVRYRYFRRGYNKGMKKPRLELIHISGIHEWITIGKAKLIQDRPWEPVKIKRTLR
tara:strand:- start:730 stop:984 length:255 start_codon:yes stop_codon:yes gene_type:complete